MSEMVKTKLNGKYEIILPKHRADRPEWYTEKGWEKARLNHMNSTIKEGDVVYYVGAEEGDMCGLLASWGAKLVLFEPNDKVWPNVKAIWDANGFDPPVASFSGFAANETHGELEAFYPHSFPPSAEGEVIGDHGFKELYDEGKTMPCVKIDDLVTAGHLWKHWPHPGPSMITMDVEGSEFEVLKGAEKTLRTYKPRIYLSLHPEFLFRMYGVYGHDVRQWIIDLGYKETLLEYEHEVHLVYEYDK